MRGLTYQGVEEVLLVLVVDLHQPSAIPLPSIINNDHNDYGVRLPGVGPKPFAELVTGLLTVC